MAEHGGGCCRCCCSFIITSGLTALFMWLSLRTSNPTCSIDKFYVPALNTSASASAANHSIYFDLKLANAMNDKGVHYANITLNLFYYNSTVANYTVPAFYQGHKKTAHRRDLVAATGVPWAEAIAAVSNGTAVEFKVRLSTRVKFKILFWYTRRHGLVVNGDVLVNSTGNKVNKKNVKLKSAATEARDSSALTSPAAPRLTTVPTTPPKGSSSKGKPETCTRRLTGSAAASSLRFLWDQSTAATTTETKTWSPSPSTISITNPTNSKRNSE